MWVIVGNILQQFNKLLKTLRQVGDNTKLGDKDANYEFYKHGPMSRTELGDLKVHGLDFAYTLQGWIKGVNSYTMQTNRDIGKDAQIGSTHAGVAKDAFGYSLHYYTGDYTQIGSMPTTDKFTANMQSSDLEAASANLYNGNIKAMVTCLPKAADYNTTKTITPEAFGNAYNYDQLNRLISSRTYTNINMGTNEWQNNGITNPQAYATDYTYDAMGNILTQKRNGAGITGSPLALDDLKYVYNSNYKDVNISSKLKDLNSNRLYHVFDNVNSSNYTDDIDNQ